MLFLAHKEINRGGLDVCPASKFGYRVFNVLIIGIQLHCFSNCRAVSFVANAEYLAEKRTGKN